MQKALIIISLFLFAGFAASFEYDTLLPLWEAWKSKHNKGYSAAEDSARYAIFVENYKKIIKFNAENENTKLGLNVFADLTNTEFKALYTGGTFPDNRGEGEGIIPVVNGPLPTSVDWRSKNAVTPIKNQGQCGSCWTFSATGALEGWHAIHKGALLSFSEQQIVDCDQGGSGCDGGWPYQALQYTGENGIEQESTYPYTGEDGTCKYDKSQTTDANTGYLKILANSRDAVLLAVTQTTVSIAIEADQDVFQLYTSGVITKDCGASLDHGVLIVGYNDDGSQQYFIVKNSWGTDWGQDGYVWISTDPTANSGAGVCGILSTAVIPK